MCHRRLQSQSPRRSAPDKYRGGDVRRHRVVFTRARNRESFTLRPVLLRRGRMTTSVLQEIPVNSMRNGMMKDFPFSCRYPRSDWFLVRNGGQWDEEEAVLRPVAICGPSGSGKSTLLKRLMSDFSEFIDFSISHTTRTPRPKEMHGKDYYFVSRQEMEKAISNGEFIEHTEFSGNIYGTSKQAVTDIQNRGRLCILDIEIEGVKTIRKTNLNPKLIFIKPPSIEVLEERLRKRGTETEESLQKRLSQAKIELEYGEEPGNFDVVIVNDDIQEAYEQLRNFLLPDIEEVRQRQL